jgi:hypothetical protein
MAFSPSPTSPTAPSTATAQHGRRSVSPPAQPTLNKREKRKHLLQDGLANLTSSFNQNRDPIFREQIKALQCDLNLIIGADPYKTDPIDDTGEDIAKLVEQTNVANTYSNEMTGLAGKWYSEYVLAVNDSKEAKDTELTVLMVSDLIFGLRYI